MYFVAPELPEGACHGFVGSASCHTQAGAEIHRWRWAVAWDYLHSNSKQLFNRLSYTTRLYGSPLLSNSSSLKVVLSDFLNGIHLPSDTCCGLELTEQKIGSVLPQIRTIPDCIFYQTCIIPVFWGLTGNCLPGLNLSELWVWPCSMPPGKDQSLAHASARSCISLLPILHYESAK